MELLPIRTSAYPSSDLRSFTSPSKITTDTRTIGSAEAKTLIATWAYNRQRLVNSGHVKYLASSITAGEISFIEIHLGIHNGYEYIVDGQHRLNALASMSPGTSLPAVIIRHAVSSETELAELYAKYDRGRTRSFGDVYSALGLCESLGMTKTDITHFTSALSLIHGNFSSTHVQSDSRAKSAQYRAKLAEEWALEGQTYFELIAGATKSIGATFRRQPVTAVALYTLRYQESLARKFWSTSALNDGLPRTSPGAALITYLLQTSVHSKSSYIYARYVAAAWNAFYESRNITRLVVKDTSSPIRILGTPLAR